MTDLVGPAQRQLPRWELTLVTLVVAMYVVLSEIDRLIRSSGGEHPASMVAASGPRFPLPFPTAESHPWLALHQLDASARGLVVAFTAADFVLLLAYGSLLYAFLRQLDDSGSVTDEAPLQLFTRPRPFLALGAALLDATENVLLLTLITGTPPEAPMRGWLVALVALATGLKWVALLLAVTPLMYGLFGTTRGRGWLRRWGRALYLQRFSLLAVLPVAALALVPGAGIFDQLPDIQRAWFEVGDGRGWDGPLHALLATIQLGLVTFGVFVLGRLFTDEAIRRHVEPVALPPTMLRQWLYGPVVLVVAALGSFALGGRLRWGPLVVFCAVPLIIAGVSYVLRRRGRVTQPAPTEEDLPLAETWRAGDMLALAGFVVASLGLVRSCTVLVVLQQGNPVQRVAPLLGLAAALAVWWFGIALLQRSADLIPLVRELVDPGHGAGLHRTAHDNAPGRAPTAPEQRRPWRLAWASILVSTAFLVAMAIWPRQLGDALGAIGAVMFALGNLMLLVGATAALHALWAPPEIFWLRWLRLRETPVVTLLLATVLAAGMGGSTPEVHGLRAGEASTAAPVTYADAVAQWETRTADCFVEVDGERLRPLVMVAAEGGGVRAAYWTAAVIDALANEAGCAAGAIVIASGVSGGSVGLATARATDTGTAGEAVWRLGADGPLARAGLGMLVRDPAHTVGGVPAVIDGRWLDRAALMETAWQQSVPGLSADFYGPPADGALAAPLVLNSTDATSGCRVLVTQLEVGDGGTARCADGDAPLPFSRDFRAWLGDSAQCPAGIDLAAAAMLSARFPYVTPSAVVGPCGSTPIGQLIDGGYAEGTGLGSLVDLAPRLLAEVDGTGPPVLPIVVYLDNGPRGDRMTAAPEARPELLVPPLGALTSGGTQKSPAALLQRAAALSVGRPDVAPTRVFVVAQDAGPTVEAPLGWVLSGASRDSMDASLGTAVSSCRSEDIPDDDYPGMAALLSLFGACA